MDKPDTQPPQKPQLDWRSMLWFAMMAMVMLWLWQDIFNAASTRTIPYSQFKTYVAAKAITQCEIRDTEIIGTAKVAALSDKSEAGQSELTAEVNPKESEPKPKSDAKSDQPETFQFRTIRIDDTNLVEELEAANVEFTGVRPSFLSGFLMSWVLPIGVLLVLWSFLARGMASVGQGVMGFGKSQAKLVADTDTGVSFADVAGCDEAKYELEEVVDFLKNSDKYTKLGAKIPKGVLLVGPPGTGKTLMARAVAGEAKVPFFSLSGSDFVEMFVGVGASRVRDLFRQATSNTPCIIFLDELDAIGRQRSVHVGTTNDEREQTLNQLLVEMDGFEANVGVILLAATNRPDVLDKALLRPGRFDRQVVLDAPDLEGRKAILAVHARNKPLADDVDLSRIAQETPGFSGADLANVMNEGALLSARHQSPIITRKDLEEAVEKVVAGPERKSRRLNAEERERVAYHETGHALVGNYSDHADPVHKISIVPRGKAALGYTLQLPTDEKFMMTKAELLDRLKGLLGGRAAEEVQFGEISTGAENDLERATAMARQMVCMYGMSDSVGLTHCGRRENVFLSDSQFNAGGLDCSENTADHVDAEVKQLLATAYEDAKRILDDHREQLDRVAQELLRTETLDATQFRKLVEEEFVAAT
ncbi:ATP-dependent zinc metalloprotease FtsH [Stieleria marina]|uniref:ATP-dependent zinc metalloprotease FtsH n=1 Tax=Stieleria marina TaxID=1930275 RepID=A0A517P033_9BACT|nr:ATP-dependent zinc metalloprotease FtsH [Planctomycetes bacterium K23_9]